MSSRTRLVRRGSFTPKPDNDPLPGLDSAEQLPVASAGAFYSRALKAREWIVEPIIPAGESTLVYGPGAAGKSLLLLQLALSVATGRPWLGKSVPQGRVLFYTCEDDLDEINRRATRVLEAYGATWHDCDDRFAVVAMRESEQSAVLATAGRSGTLEPSPTYRSLKQDVATYQPALVIIDTLADVFAGNENDRGHAKQFVKLIEGLGRATYVLTAHPSVSGQADGRGASGSTGWPASVRSHLYMERARSEDGAEPDPDVRRLSNKKANYARAGDGEIELRWQDGVFVPIDRVEREGATADAADRVFLELLETFNRRKVNVSTSPGSTYAPSAFAKEEMAKKAGVTKRKLVEAMGRLLDEGKIRNVAHRTGADARYHLEVAKRSEIHGTVNVTAP